MGWPLYATGAGHAGIAFLQDDSQDEAVVDECFGCDGLDGGVERVYSGASDGGAGEAGAGAADGAFVDLETVEWLADIISNGA